MGMKPRDRVATVKHKGPICTPRVRRQAQVDDLTLSRRKLNIEDEFEEDGDGGVDQQPRFVLREAQSLRTPVPQTLDIQEDPYAPADSLVGRSLNFYSNSVIKEETISHNPRASGKLGQNSLRRTATLKNESLPSMMLRNEEDQDEEEEKHESLAA